MAARLKDIESTFSYDLGKRLKSARVCAGLSQADIANSLGVTFQQIQKYEMGTNRLSLYKLMVWAKLTNNPVSYFWEDPPVGCDGVNTTRLYLIKGFNALSKPAQSQILGIIKMMNGGGDE